MRIAILSRGQKLYSTRRLREACKERGHDVLVLNPMRFGIDVERGNPDLYYRGKRLRDYDAVIPRIGASITFFGTAVIRQFEQMGVFSLNPSHSISVSRDKLRSIQVLSRHHIGFPQTVFAKDKENVLSALERLGTPSVIKLLEGTQGVGVILAETQKIAEAIMETLQQAAGQNVLLQEFIKESRGQDVRALVVGEEVVAFIVPHPGHTVAAEALDRLCLENIARFKRPKDYRFVEALAKNNYGKILKTELRALFEAEKAG